LQPPTTSSASWTVIHNQLFSYCRHNRLPEMNALIATTFGTHDANAALTTLQDEYGNNLLHVAAQNGLKKMSKLLVKQYGIDINIRNRSRRTPLYYCLKYEKSHLAEWFRKHGAVL
jgi:hypothetical protein